MKPMPVNESGKEKTLTAVPIRAPIPNGNAAQEVLWGKDEAVERLDGDEELFWELCEIFLEESPKLLQKLGQAIAESDAEAVMRAAHSLKGELGYLGAVEALQVSRALENMGHENNLSEAAAMFASLELHLAALHLAMKASARTAP
jgi:two-component system, sensor histidine kinase and response regulator